MLPSRNTGQTGWDRGFIHNICLLVMMIWFIINKAVLFYGQGG